MRGRGEITSAQDLAVGQGNRQRGMQLFRKSSRNPLLQVQVLWDLCGPELGGDFLPLSGALFRSALPKPVPRDCTLKAVPPCGWENGHGNIKGDQSRAGKGGGSLVEPLRDETAHESPRDSQK